jgi:hypothetical protein
MPENIAVNPAGQVLKYLAANHPFLPSNAISRVSGNSYKIRLSSALSISSPGSSTISGEKYYKIGQHLYFSNNGGWSLTGGRHEQQTAGSKTGVKLTGHIERLPGVPAGYVPPPLWTDPKKSFAVANMYKDCGGMCFAVAIARVRHAYLYTSGIIPINLRLTGQDYNISGTGTINRNTIPNAYFGYGVGGALAARGYADLVTNTAVWKGALQEGALVQYWWGNDPAAITKDNYSLAGHSIIFKSYNFDASGNITGFNFHDYRGTNRLIDKATSGRVFLGANIRDKKI